MFKTDLKKNMVRQAHHRQKGFTLLEALVAISILMVAVSAPITIAQKGLSSAVYSKDQMVASYLAQDVLEYIKNKRDETVINNPADSWSSLWQTGVDNTLDLCTKTAGCQIDTISGVVSAFDFSDKLWVNSDGFYQYSNQSSDSRETRFARKIEITREGLDKALVKVTVGWGEDINSKNRIEVNALIFNY